MCQSTALNVISRALFPWEVLLVFTLKSMGWVSTWPCNRSCRPKCTELNYVEYSTKKKLLVHSICGHLQNLTTVTVIPQVFITSKFIFKFFKISNSFKSHKNNFVSLNNSLTTLLYIFRERWGQDLVLKLFHLRILEMLRRAPRLRAAAFFRSSARHPPLSHFTRSSREPGGTSHILPGNLLGWNTSR